MNINELKKALAMVSVLTVGAYIISSVLFWIIPKFNLAELVLGVFIGFNLIFMTIHFRRAINPSSFFDLDTSFKSKIIIQYTLNILIFIIFILRS